MENIRIVCKSCNKEIEKISIRIINTQDLKDF